MKVKTIGDLLSFGLAFSDNLLIFNFGAIFFSLVFGFVFILWELLKVEAKPNPDCSF